MTAKQETREEREGNEERTKWSHKQDEAYTEVAHCCRGRPRFRRRAQFLGMPSGSHKMSLIRDGSGELAIRLYRAIWRSFRISDNGVDDARCSTSLLRTRETKEWGIPNIRRKHLQWKLSNLDLSAFKSHTESKEYMSLLSTQLEYIMCLRKSE